MKPARRLKLAALGCGDRATLYLSYAARMADRYEIVAAADPVARRRERIAVLSDHPQFRAFVDDRALFAEPRLADVLIVGTQDVHHFEHASAAMLRGYDLLLEKPIAANLRDVLALERLAWTLGRKVLVCHVLRYTPLYRRVKELLDEGAIGELVSFEATEGVEPWHHAHSFVRGPWSVTQAATPMIIAKACHDLDLLAWLVGARCRSVASFGGLAHFSAERAPREATARCTDGCGIAERCAYSALRYIADKRSWLGHVYDRASEATEAQVRDWLGTSPWGRCVYRCDNDAVDHQSVSLAFENGVAGVFTMTAFAEGRDLALYGTKARLFAGARMRRAAGCDIVLEEHATGRTQRIDVEVPAGDRHGGGDAGLMDALYFEMTESAERDMASSLSRSIESHVMGFAAEAARRSGKVIDVADFRRRHDPEPGVRR